MKALALALCLLSLVFTVNSRADQKSELQQAREATAAFAAALKSELVAAMQTGGPVAAIEVCNTRAPAISERLSMERGMALSRVSFRNRNPGNAPSEWQARVLDTFSERMQAGEEVASLSWHDVADTNGGKEFRFMKAIPTASICLQCHGVAIAPEVAAKLADLYPEDKATGFREGDLRGAFVVTRKLD